VDERKESAGGRRRRVSIRSVVPAGAVLVLFAALTPIGQPLGGMDAQGPRGLEVAVVSSPADMVTGGTALVRITLPPQVPLEDLLVVLGDRDITDSFRIREGNGDVLGRITGLDLGRNTLSVHRGKPAPVEQVELTLVNHPISGPVFTGPKQEPFICQTEEVTTAAGTLLGPPLAANCSVTTVVEYLYRTAEGALMPLLQGTDLPDDVDWISTEGGKRVPYVVRVETGTINRSIYELAILHDPSSEPEPDPWYRSRGWNGRLIYTFGGGCRGGWYSQGSNTGGVLDDFMLRQGFAVASASLNVFGNNCDDFLAAETMMMVKERFIEAYGLPRFTIGWGCSGGSYQVHQIGDNYPGLLDGIIPGCSFPDVAFATSIKLADSRLLERYFTLAEAEGHPSWTREEQRAVAGFRLWESVGSMSVGAARLDPVKREDRVSAEFKSVVPDSVRYDPERNPSGARATVYDHGRNVFGVDPSTGFARRPLDNVGVQYGLEALRSGAIDPEQFVHLNEWIGGLDLDAEFVRDRMEADPDATRAAYRSGRMLHGGGGLATMPIIDYRAYSDDLEGGDIHMIYHQFSTRERLSNANGYTDNHVMLVEDFRYGFYSSQSPVLRYALMKMDEWLLNLEQGDPTRRDADRVRRARPADLEDSCWDPQGERIREPLGFDRTGRCSELYPAFPSPRMVAGGPLSSDVIKCSLTRLDRGAYPVSFSDEQWARLGSAFPQGVCDWTLPGQHRDSPPTPWWRFVE